MSELMTLVVARYNYWIYIVLILIGLYAIVTKRNLVKKIVGMNIMQTAIILFYVSLGVKKNATLPIIAHGHDNHGAMAADLINPLPHVLMLTAIVVAVATLGVALALCIKIYRQYGTLEEDEINEFLRSA